MFNKVKSILVPVLKSIFKITFIYVGAFVGIFSVFLVSEYPVPVTIESEEGMIFLFTSAVVMVQISFLTSVTWGLAKLAKVRLFSSPYRNFAIGLLFSLIPEMLLPIIERVKFLSGVLSGEGPAWLYFVILPIIVFLPLVYIDYLLSSRK